MKNLVKTNEEGWVWPLIDQNCWNGLQSQTNLYEDIKTFLKGNKIMVQAGGNCGFILSKFVPHFEHVYTFEPDPVNFYCLNQNVTEEHVIKFQCCLGNKNELVKVQQLIRPDRPHDIGGVHINGVGYTPTMTIDQLNLPDCNLIQLDIEGYEYNAILGAEQTIKKYKPILCIEWCEKWANRYNITEDNLQKLLKQWNYINVKNSGVDRIYT
jgi:FkbM family methyltransferase